MDVKHPIHSTVQMKKHANAILCGRIGLATTGTVRDFMKLPTENILTNIYGDIE
jgi:hypothetical protein